MTVVVLFLAICAISYVQANQQNLFRKPTGIQRNVQLIEQKNNNKVFCTHDSLLMYSDCRMCVCPKPNRQAKCFSKSCDLRTKDTGQCPPAVLKMDDNKLCPNNAKPSCQVDNDCPGPQLCCFDFCRGPQCMNPINLDPGITVHGGRGYTENQRNHPR